MADTANLASLEALEVLKGKLLRWLSYIAEPWHVLRSMVHTLT